MDQKFLEICGYWDIFVFFDLEKITPRNRSLRSNKDNENIFGRRQKPHWEKGSVYFSNKSVKCVRILSPSDLSLLLRHGCFIFKSIRSGGVKDLANNHVKSIDVALIRDTERHVIRGKDQRGIEWERTRCARSGTVAAGAERNIDCRRVGAPLPLAAALRAARRPSGSQLTRVTRLTADPTHAAVVAQPPSHCRPRAPVAPLSLSPPPRSLALHDEHLPLLVFVPSALTWLPLKRNIRIFERKRVEGKGGTKYGGKCAANE